MNNFQKNIYSIYIQKNFKLVDKAFQNDIGFDVKCIKEPDVIGEKFIGEDVYLSIDYIEYDTGIRIDPTQRNKEKIFCLLFPRSSISNKTSLVLANSIGLVDPDYRESIKFRFRYLYQPSDLININDKIALKLNRKKIYSIGDKIGQIVFCKNIDVDLKYVDELSQSIRSGFGSTGD